MSSPKAEDALGHWGHLIEGLQVSVLDYYSALKTAIGQRKIPGIKIRQVNFAEGGVLDARREYLRIEREELKLDVCAAPFGTGFFFSWWLSARPRRWWLWILLAGIGLLLLTWYVPGIRSDTRTKWTFFIVLLVGIGAPLAQRLLKRTTYYTVDTILMFKAAVHQAVTETIDALKTTKGLRALTEDEKKPIMRDFLK